MGLVLGFEEEAGRKVVGNREFFRFCEGEFGSRRGGKGVFRVEFYFVDIFCRDI